MAAAVCRYAELALPAVAASVPQARAFVAEWLTGWGVPGDRDELLLVTSELVSNAVLHGRTDVEVVLSVAGGVVEVAVSDRNRQAPRPRAAASDDVGGRGMMLVQSLCDEWGVDQRMDGKSVWCRTTVSVDWPYRPACVCEARSDAADERRSGSGRRVVILDPGETAPS